MRQQKGNVEMSKCPAIVVYRVCEVTVYTGNYPSYIARYWSAGDFLPMIFSGDTAEAAIAAAQAFWMAETAKIEARRARLTSAREGRRQKA